MENCLAMAMEEYYREEKGEWEWERKLGGENKAHPRSVLRRGDYG